jgi:ceramide glucosyltransferase
VWSWLAFACLLAAAAGCLYLCAATVLVGRFARGPAPAPGKTPPVTILKPLHGEEPGLEDNLLSFCTQDYAGPVQVVFGVQDPRDPAVGPATRLIEKLPDKSIELVIDVRRHGSNAKVSNLVNMAERIRHDVVVLADSDMRVGPDYLARVVAALQRPGIGGVTCLYRGIQSNGIWSQLSALAIDTHFLPNVIVGVSLGLARPCFGSTIALRRTTLAEIGGFEAFADVLADDYAVGAALRARGHAVAIPPFVIGHVCHEGSWGELWRHELRWGRTIRAVDPAGYAGLALTHPLPFAVLGGLFGGGTTALLLGMIAMAARVALCLRLERAFGLMPHPYWLLPLRDLLSFAAFIAGFLGASVSWRGHDYRVTSEGNLVPEQRPPIP